MKGDRHGNKTQGKQWQRVHGTPPIDQEAGKKYQAREQTLKNPLFLKACAKAGIEPTPRQARKWNMGRGKAYSAKS